MAWRAEKRGLKTPQALKIFSNPQLISNAHLVHQSGGVQLSSISESDDKARREGIQKWYIYPTFMADIDVRPPYVGQTSHLEVSYSASGENIGGNLEKKIRK